MNLACQKPLGQLQNKWDLGRPPPLFFFQNSHIFPFFWKTSIMLQIVGLSRISGTVPVRHCRQSSLLCISCLKESTAFLFADARACTLAPVKSTVMVAPPPISSPAEHTGGSPLGVIKIITDHSSFHNNFVLKKAGVGYF